MRDLYVKLQNLVRRARVDRPGVKPQVAHLGDALVPDVEHMEPQGVHFIAPSGAQGVLLSPNGVTAAAVALGLGGAVPTDSVAAGEGGLHYLGAYKVFLKADGTLALGAFAPSDWVALASKVDSELTSIKSDLTGIKAAFDAHTHILALSLGTGTASPPASPAPAPHTPASVASATVKVTP